MGRFFKDECPKICTFKTLDWKTGVSMLGMGLTALAPADF